MKSLVLTYAVIAWALLDSVSLAAADSGLPLSQVGLKIPESSLAQVESPRRSDIAAGLDAIITNIAVLEAQRVKSGETLFTFDCRAHQLALDRAELALRFSRTNAQKVKMDLDRSSILLKSRSASQAQNDAARLAYVSAELDVSDKQVTRDAAALTVESCNVKAPFTGVVSKVVSGPGSYQTAGSVILSMVETENLRVVAQLTPEEIDILGADGNMAFLSGDENFSVGERVVEPLFDQILGTQRVILQLPDDADLPVGLNGVLRWQGGRYSLPGDYLIRQGAQIGLTIENDGKQEFYPVPGAIEGLSVTVRLPADTKVFKP